MVSIKSLVNGQICSTGVGSLYLCFSNSELKREFRSFLKTSFNSSLSPEVVKKAYQ